MREGVPNVSDWLGDYPQSKRTLPDSGMTVELVFRVLGELVSGATYSVDLISGEKKDGRLKRILAGNEELKRYVGQRSPGSRIHLLIDSHGGALTVERYFSELLTINRNQGGKSYAYVPRQADSAASGIALATDELYMLPQARCKLHSGFKVGDEDLNAVLLRRFRISTDALFGSLPSNSRGWAIAGKIFFGRLFPRGDFELSARDLECMGKSHILSSVDELQVKFGENADLTPGFVARHFSDFWARAGSQF